MKSIFKLGLAFVTAGLLTMAAPGHATLISSSSNNPLNFSWSQTVLGSDGLLHTLTGSGVLVISGFNSSLLTLSITLNNTSGIGGMGGERLTGFGFGVDPNAMSVGFSDSADGGMINAALGQNFPAYQAVEVCAFGGPNCSGGSNGGIFAGTSDSFVLLLGGLWGTAVNIDPIAFKYQTGYGSFEFLAGGGGGGGGGGNVSEPSRLALAGLGLAILAAFARRRKAPALGRAQPA